MPRRTRLDGQSSSLPPATSIKLRRSRRRQRFPEITRSTRSTISALSTNFARCDEELARHRTELARLQAQIQLLTTERQTLQNHYDDCRALLAPIRRLPSEVLGSIFHLCRYSDENEENPSGLSLGHRILVQKPLHSISRVCIHWRRIVIGTPTYWTTIDICNGLTIKTPRDLKLLTVALERSRSSPLEVTIYNDELALRLLVEFSERWKIADVHFGAIDCSVFLRLASRLPLLEKLWIRAFPILLPPGRALDDFIEAAPRLRNLTIAAPLMPTWNKPLLRQLCSLALTSVYPAYITRCVVLMSELSPVAQLALYLEDKMTAFIRLVSALTLPGLTTLTLRAKYANIPWPHAEFHALAARSRFHDRLLALDLRGTHISQSELLECLGALPCLERLNIGDRADGIEPYYAITDELLQSLTVTDIDDSSSQCPAPRLLCLRLFTLGKFDDEVYITFLRSRMHHLALVNPGQLFECGIEWLMDAQRDLAEAAVEQIDELRKSGRLKFSLIAGEDEWEDYWNLREGDFDPDWEAQ
ncbi:hypothetical protein FB45DRAFT_1007857 [Roridomyces roridus]|uniref:F-box domain-containing protein n=1 Tax=Roridomyces roridus TaxID=1738132 RepID=A0AAD7FFJ5_9AGAR|nr:hypothetical protein FB45DRAFT_1007857 [Roridomyces roridus]